MWRKIFQVVFLLCVIALGIFMFLYFQLRAKPATQFGELREDTNQYHFINPLLLAGSNDKSEEYNNLRVDVENFINTSVKSGNASNISFYFRDINSGKWTGVNEDDLYDPSSMLKVALMIGYLRNTVDDPEILNKKLLYTPKNDPGQHYPPAVQLTVGYHTIKELISSMIVYSDNDALTALYDNNRDALVETMKVLRIPPPLDTTQTDFVSPKIYSRLFRILYSATYLPPELSEQALSLLTSTTFKVGFIAGLPVGTVVAHKFGEHTTTNGLGQVESRQLHECGIVYYPSHPYFLCVMTRGQDFSKLESIISNIAGISYKDAIPQP